MELCAEFKVQSAFLLCAARASLMLCVCITSIVHLPTLEGVQFCPAHCKFLSPRTPELRRRVECGIRRGAVFVFPLGVGGVWMVEGDDGELLYSIGTGEMEKVELHSGDLIKQLQGNGSTKRGREKDEVREEGRGRRTR